MNNTIDDIVENEPEPEYGNVYNPADDDPGDHGDQAKGISQVPGVFLLPSPDTSFDQSSRNIFGIIGPKRDLFCRGRAIVELVSNESGPVLEVLTPSRFRTKLDEFGLPVMAWRRNNEGEPSLAYRRCPEESAKALLTTKAAFELLPQISVVSASPVLIPDADGQPLVAGQGYTPAGGGVLVTSSVTVKSVPIARAVEAILDLVTDFNFVTPGDHARALASFISPALRMGGWLKCNFPIDVAEADQSQSGKTYRQRLVRAIYGESAYAIGQKSGGVGSLDESLSAALLSGKPFISLDNIRGRIESQYLEMVLTWSGAVNVRVPHRGEIAVDCSRVNFQMTSNGVETTRDLANRSSIIRIRKMPSDYQFKHFSEGDILAHVAANQGHYLGSVFAIVRAWIAAGKPMLPCSSHDFREWAGVMEWFSQNLFKAGPVMDGHLSAQERVSNPALSWLRTVAMVIVRAGQAGKSLSASAINELCEIECLDIPGMRANNQEHAPRAIGRLLSKCFGNDTTITIDGMTIFLTEEQEYFPSGQCFKPVKKYVVNT